MDLQCLDHLHFSVPELARAQALYGPFFGGRFTPTYGGPALNAWGSWNTSGGDFLQVIELGKPVFGGAPIRAHGMLAISFRVAEIDAGIAQASALGLQLRSRIGSEEVGLGGSVIQAQFAPQTSFGVACELIEHQLPDPHPPLCASVLDHVEHDVEDLAAPVAFFSELFGSPFDPVFRDDALGVRSMRHARFGLQFSAPTSASGSFAKRLEELGPGTHAVAFRSRDLARDVAVARSLGLARVRERSCGPGACEVEFAAEAGVILKLVQRSA